MPGSTRQRFIDTANDLFFQHGFHAVGLDQIIERVGVTKTTFYNHFESKDNLIIAVLHERDRQETTEWLAIIRQRGGGTPRGELLALFDLLEDWLAASDFRGCMFLKAASEFPSPSDPVHQAAMTHSASLFNEIEERTTAMGARDPAALARQLMLVLAGAILSREASGAVDIGRSARSAAGMLVDASPRGPITEVLQV